ncbi:hypothetical protein BS17DRAFT_768800 [Gyrodon lividus]|nr:hypothetical protein BS17DRAFT_768800 [Gyrodon lividus]
MSLMTGPVHSSGTSHWQHTYETAPPAPNNGETKSRQGSEPQDEVIFEVKGIRNMLFFKSDRIKRDDAPATVSSSTTSMTTPFRNSATHRMPSEQQTRDSVDAALNDELGDARYLADDLGDLMFGSLISTELAKQVLQGLLEVGVVSVQKVVGEKRLDVMSDSVDAKVALEHAYQRALAHGCQRSDIEQTKTPSKSKGSTEIFWSWRWTEFPKSTIMEAPLMDYFNRIVETALHLQCLRGQTLRYRFAAPIDTRHAFPLAYGPDKEDMRPDFVVLPIDAFDKTSARDPKDPVEYTPKKEWFNFTTIRLSGECKISDSNKGVNQVQRYMRGTKRAQPWQRFVTALTVTRDVVNFMRADGSGIERLKMQLDRGRSSLEFVRVLLAVALGDPKVFGKSSAIDVQLLPKPTLVALPKSTPHPSQPTDPFTPAPSSSNREVQASYPRTRSSTRNSQSKTQTSVSSQKRKRDEDEDVETAPLPARKAALVEIDQMVQIPATLFETYQYEGTLFNAASLRGRGTVVLVVHAKDLPNVRVVLKMSWQDVARGAQQTDVQNILQKVWQNDSRVDTRRAHVLIPESIPIEEDRTLRGIRAFTNNDIQTLLIEDRILQVHRTELRRPVAYFWSAHDFVLGLCDAIKGHAYLVDIGILHRDVSENNIVMGCHPKDTRGCIMDFDMAVPYTPQSLPAEQDIETLRSNMIAKLTPKETLKSSQTGPFKADRTGTAPYMSVDVLTGKGHDHFDDLESFFYVLLLFFLSYQGPMSKDDLSLAQDRGFTLAVGRPAHICSWPPEFQSWSGAHTGRASQSKLMLLIEDCSGRHFDEIAGSLQGRWGSQDLRKSIMGLIFDSWKLFVRSPQRARVSHQQFIDVLGRKRRTNSLMVSIWCRRALSVETLYPSRKAASSNNIAHISDQAFQMSHRWPFRLRVSYRRPYRCPEQQGDIVGHRIR